MDGRQSSAQSVQATPAGSSPRVGTGKGDEASEHVSGDEVGTRPKLVSIGVPIYKRLEFLPAILAMVEAQDYPAIELIISDNGENGTKVRDLVTEKYHRRGRFRQNPATVDIVRHHNQIVESASGEYFYLLSDDDEISPNFISELVGLLERNPDASLAYSKLEIIDREGHVIKRSKDDVPPKLSGPEFIRAIWQTYQYGFENVEGYLSRTKQWKEIGGFPRFTKGYHIDNAAVIALCLNSQVVFSTRCTYRHRVYLESFGKTISMKELAAASRDFMRWLNSDPTLLEFSRRDPGLWEELRNILVQMTWETYLWRWKEVYRARLSALHWAREAFRMPYIPPYYERVIAALRQRCKARIKRLILPRASTEPGAQPAAKMPDMAANGE